MSKIKKKISVLTQQDLLSGTADNGRYVFIRSCAKWASNEHKQKGARIAKAIDALPKPLVLEDVQQILNEGDLSEGWWANDFKPRCDLCEKGHEQVMIVHEALCDEHEMDLSVCAGCIDELKSKRDSQL